MKLRMAGYGIIVLVAYLFFLLVTFPATTAYQIVKDYVPALNLSGIEGTLWSGSASSSQVAGLKLDHLDWRLRILPLFTGHLEFKCSVQGPEISGAMQAGIGLTTSGDPYLKKAEGQALATLISSQISYLQAQATGTLKFSMDYLRFKNNRLSSAIGTVLWREAGLESPFPVELGTLQFVSRTVDSQIQIAILDQDGPLKIQGDLNLDPEGNYTFKGSTVPRASAAPELVRALRNFGQVDSSGAINFQYSGRI